MEIRAQYRGKAQAFQSLGFSADQVKVAFLHDGLPEYYAEVLVKEAFIGRALSMGAKGVGMVSKALGRGAGAAAKWGAQGARQGGRMGKLQGKAGLMAGRSAKGLQAGIQGMQKAPGQTMLGGAKNFAQGAVGMGGKGVGGNLGRAALASSFIPTGSSY